MNPITAIALIVLAKSRKIPANAPIRIVPNVAA